MRDWIDQERVELIHKAHQIGQLTVRPKGIERVELVHAGLLRGQYDLARVWQAIAAFPESAQERILSVLRMVMGDVPTYFHRQCATGELRTTPNHSQSLGNTYIVPSSYWIEGKSKLGYGIALYRLPGNFTSRENSTLILVHGLLHELAHVLVGASWSKAEWEPAIIEFVRIMAARNLPPISHYSAAYWENTAELMPPMKSDGSYGEMSKGLDEELAETIAAWILKFCFCEPYYVLTDNGRQRIEIRGRASLSQNPFSDRREIEEWVSCFLFERR